MSAREFIGYKSIKVKYAGDLTGFEDCSILSETPEMDCYELLNLDSGAYGSRYKYISLTGCEPRQKK
jgi:hypothetical protein